MQWRLVNSQGYDLLCWSIYQKKAFLLSIKSSCHGNDDKIKDMKKQKCFQGAEKKKNWIWMFQK